MYSILILSKIQNTWLVVKNMIEKGETSGWMFARQAQRQSSGLDGCQRQGDVSLAANVGAPQPLGRELSTPATLAGRPQHFLIFNVSLSTTTNILLIL